MEQKNIPLDKGVSRSPFSTGEGELAECVNLIPTNGELVNIQPPKDLGITLLTTETLVYVHTSGTYTHYIAYDKDNATLVYYEKDGTRKIITDSLPSYTDINSVGNTLIVLTENKRIFFLFDSGTYRMLGDLPELPNIRFSLYSSLDEEEYTSETACRWYAEAEVVLKEKEDDESLNNKRDAVYATTNLLRETAYKKGYFIYPFKICYVLTYYDDSTARGSAPILMMPSTHTTFSNVVINDNKQRLRMIAQVCQLIREIRRLPDNILDWKDVIKSVDYYITAPKQTLDETANNKSFQWVEFEQYIDTYPTGIYTNNPVNTDGDTVHTIPPTNYSDYYFKDHFINLPYYSPKSIESDIMKDGTFYFLGSENIKDIYDSYVHKKEVYPVPNVDKTLPTIKNQKTLPLEYFSNTDIIPQNVFTYNGRANYYNIYRTVFKGYKYFSHWKISANGRQYYRYKIYVRIKTDTKEERVVMNEFYDILEIGFYFYYPDPGAYEAIIEKYSGNIKMGDLTLPLTEHPALNGAYYFSGFPTKDEETIPYQPNQTPVNIKVNDSPTHYTNKIYTSEVDNPFSVTVENVNTIGSGAILAVSTATKALSQGQFGQFPLYVFCSDGIYTMQVSDAGTISSVHPVSRDVCNNPASVTQLDNSIVFTTDKGLMLLQGSDVTLLSGKMDGNNLDETIYNVEEGFEDLFVKDTAPFTAMLKTCTMSYDYSHSLLHIFPADGGGKHHVLSLATGEFSSYAGYDIKAAVPAYPQNVIQIGDRLHTFDRLDDPETARRGILITRPMSFGNPMALKVLADVRMLYSRTSEETKCRIAAWVSNDLLHWFRLRSLRAGSFKWYRFAIFTRMTDDDALVGLTALTGERRSHKLK